MIFTWRGLLWALCQGALRETPVTEALGRARLALDCTAAVVKVGILLFLKMLLLPLLLGACLDRATLTVFEASSADRIRFTSSNLVGSLLLHWVLGITFMLFVTVSVLQLREVLHPDIFAAVIRPQVNARNRGTILLGKCLGSLSSFCTSMNRACAVCCLMCPFPLIGALLFHFVWLPACLFQKLAPASLPVTLNLFYLLPQIQVHESTQRFAVGAQCEAQCGQ